MAVLRVLFVFLCGVGATLGLYFSGLAQRIPEWYASYIAPPPPDVVPAPVVVDASPPPSQTTYPPGYGGSPPGYGTDSYGNNSDGGEGYGGEGASDSPPPSDVAPPAYTAPSDVAGAPLQLTIVPSRRGFEATCTVYAIANHSQRTVLLNVAGGKHNDNGSREGLLVKPGETIAHETLPDDCAEYRAMFAEDSGGPLYGTPPVPSDGQTWGEPFVKIEIQDCAVGGCSAAQY